MIFLVVCPEPDCPIGKDRPRDEYPDRAGAAAFVLRHAFTGHKADIQEIQVNATDDGEPLGESPAIDTLTAIGRGAVAGILSAADEVLATKQLAERQGRDLSTIRARAHEALKYPRSQAYNEAVLREIAAIADEAGA